MKFPAIRYSIYSVSSFLYVHMHACLHILLCTAFKIIIVYSVYYYSIYTSCFFISFVHMHTCIHTLLCTAYIKLLFYTIVYILYITWGWCGISATILWQCFQPYIACMYICVEWVSTFNALFWFLWLPFISTSQSKQHHITTPSIHTCIIPHTVFYMIQ